MNTFSIGHWHFNFSTMKQYNSTNHNWYDFKIENDELWYYEPIDNDWNSYGFDVETALIIKAYHDYIDSIILGDELQ